MGCMLFQLMDCDLVYAFCAPKPMFSPGKKNIYTNINNILTNKKKYFDSQITLNQKNVYLTFEL